MPQWNPTDQRNSPRRRPWLLRGVVCICVFGLTLAGVTLFAEGTPAADNEYTQAQLLDETLGVAHDELIMLIISLVVVIQIAASFKFIRQLPHNTLFVCSFGGMALSVFFTVIEGFVFTEVFNYFEHLSFMAGAILLAVWCGLVFGFKKQEGN